MTTNSTSTAEPTAPEVRSRDESMPSLSGHSARQKRTCLLVLAFVIVLLASVWPLLAKSSYRGSADLHAAIEMVGALLGLVAGVAIVVHFYSLGNRLHLFIGLAFFVNAAEDLIHGLLSFPHLNQMIEVPASSLDRFVPGTYVTGRLLMGGILLLAPALARRPGKGRDPKRETVLVSLVVLLIAAAATAAAFLLPLPQFIFPDSTISRPVDFLSALILLAAGLVFLSEYRREGAMLTWWVLLSIGINTVGQLMMSFSRHLYDPCFDIAHVYKVFGYIVPLLGFSLYQGVILTERKQAMEKLEEHREHLEELVDERTAALEERTQDLGERLKELGCLYGISEIVQRPGISLEEILHGAVQLIAPSWQYPEITCGRLVLQGREYRTDNFTETPWRQAADIFLRGELAGRVEVYYLEERPEKAEGPFLKGERHLIEAIAQQLAGIIEQKRAETEIATLKQQIEFILGATKTGIDIIDSEFNLRYIDPEWQKVYGDPAGRKCYEYFMDRDEVCPGCGIVKALETKEIAVAEEVLVKENNRPIQVTTMPFQNYEGEWLVAEVNTDITERKRAEEELRRYAADLERANREVRQFAYIVSHDLRAPLVNLKGFAAELRLALEEVCSTTKALLPQLPEEQRRSLSRACDEDVPEALQFIESSASRMDRFINSILKLSRMGHRELTLERINMDDLVRDILQDTAFQMEERGIKMKVGPLPEIMADRTSMEQIMGNLLSNAVKYLDPNRPGAIEITSECESDRVTFHVRDDGRGIAASDMEKVFAPFRRAGKQDVKGEGMGLAYVQTLVQRHGGGRIRCESEEGVGTTFSFTIPAHPEQGENHG